MPNPVLYSTNVFLKLHIQERYRGDVHYVWCSEDFDSKMLSAYSAGAKVGRSSNPADIYRELQADVNSQDTHSAKIKEQRASLTTLAVGWFKSGEISQTDKDDILWLAKNASFAHWRPLIYVIPRLPVEARLQPVPAYRRAGLGNEYILSDLKRSEFDVIEL